MAEYYMSYQEILDEVERFIKEAPEENQENLNKYKAQIMAAVTADYEDQEIQMEDVTQLWQNQLTQKTEMRIGHKYICVQKIMLDFLQIFINSGLADALITSLTTGNPVVMPSMSLSASTGVAIPLWDLFQSVKNLDDWDFCIYFQALTHFREHKEFTLEELKEWIPSAEERQCNMHTHEWDCTYYSKNDDSCNLHKNESLNSALKSLHDKKILVMSSNGTEPVYRFVK